MNIRTVSIGRLLLPFAGIFTLFLTGCATSARQMTLFAVDGREYALPASPAFVLEKGDMLQIHFSALDMDAVEPYNSAGKEFVVEKDGTVRLPVLGSVELAGKTEQEAVAVLTEAVRGQLKEPVVKLNITNASVTMLGELRVSQRLQLTQPVSILEAVGMAGGFTANARRDNVMVQRREGDKIILHRINLLTDDVFASPCFYLQKGDVVYVSPLHSVKSSNK